MTNMNDNFKTGTFTLHFLLPEPGAGRQTNIFNIVGNDINAMCAEVEGRYPDAIIPDWGLWVDTEAGQYRLANEYVRRWRDGL